MAYGILRVKNIDVVDGTYCGQLIPAGEIYTVQDIERPNWQASTSVFDAITNNKIQIGNASEFFVDKVQQWNIVLDHVSLPISEIPAFAQPTHRTKNDATPSLVNITPGESAVVDYYITAERYVSGGEMIIENACLGDYVTAEVYDGNGVIPVPYRAALCENHPTVAKYVVKRWIMPANAQGYSFCVLDTRPLTAKITAGLFLRVTYYAVNSGSTRCIGVNYHLTQKL